MAIVKPRKKSIAKMGLDREFIRIAGIPHVRTSPYYPQSNGKLERWHKSLKSECIRTGIPLTRVYVLRLIQTYVDHDNTVRLHSAIGFVTPTDMRDSEYNGSARGNGSRLCGDTTMLRDNLVGSSRR